MAFSNVLALLQVRNAIQRMKDKKKALSFTVSCKEALQLPFAYFSSLLVQCRKNGRD